MSKLTSINYENKEWKVSFKQSPNVSKTNMKKSGLVWHMTTSMSYKGGLSWLTQKRSQVSALFIVGRNPGEITQMGTTDQKFWHAGRVYQPSDRFKAVAKKTPSGKYTNPNLYLDGVEFVGGEDTDRSGKVETDEIELTEWQYECAEQIAEWHSQVCVYELVPGTQVIHQDIASYKPDMTNIIDEIEYRTCYEHERNEFHKACEIAKEKALLEKEKAQKEVIRLSNILNMILKYLKLR